MWIASPSASAGPIHLNISRLSEDMRQESSTAAFRSLAVKPAADAASEADQSGGVVPESIRKRKEPIMTEERNGRITESQGETGESLISRYRGSLLGPATEDALGTTVEFTTPGDLQPLSNVVGGGFFRFKPWLFIWKMRLRVNTVALAKSDHFPVACAEVSFFRFPFPVLSSRLD